MSLPSILGTPTARVVLSLAVQAALFLSVPAKAQAPGPPPTITRGEFPEPKQDRLPETNPLIDVEKAGIRDLPCPLAGERFGSARLVFQRVNFEGGEGLDLQLLAPAYNRFLGRAVLPRDICVIRDAAVQILAENGYLAQVQVPPQPLDRETLSMKLVVGRLVALRVRGNARHSRHLLSEYLEPLQRNAPFNWHEAERHLRLANSIPGYRISLALQQAESGVEGDLVGIVSAEFQRVRANANITNFKPRPTPWVVNAGLELNSLLGWGDRTYLGFFGTPDRKALRGFQIGQDFRFGTSGIGLGLDFVRADAELALDELELHDKVTIVRAEGTYSFDLWQGTDATVGAGLDYSDRLVTLLGPAFEDKLRVAYARLTLNRRTLSQYPLAPGSRFSVNGFVELRQGLDILGATKACGDPSSCFLDRAPPSRLNGDPTATVFRLGGNVEYRPIAKFALRLRPFGQYSSSTLLADEKFAVGPYTIGRGYPQGAAEGDAAIAFAAEAEFGEQPRSSRDFAMSVYAFVDYAYLVRRLESGSSTDTIRSIGGGLRAAVGDRARLDAAIAIPLKNLELVREKGEMKFLISLTTSLVPLPFLEL